MAKCLAAGGQCAASHGKGDRWVLVSSAAPSPPLSSRRPQNKLTDLEVLALLIAALSHDLDHRGVNNSYIQR